MWKEVQFLWRFKLTEWQGNTKSFKMRQTTSFLQQAKLSARPTQHRDTLLLTECTMFEQIIWGTWWSSGVLEEEITVCQEITWRQQCESSVRRIHQWTEGSMLAFSQIRKISTRYLDGRPPSIVKRRRRIPREVPDRGTYQEQIQFFKMFMTVQWTFSNKAISDLERRPGNTR